LQFSDFALSIRKLGKGAIDMPQQDFTGGRQAQPMASSSALKERNAQFFFQQRDLPAYR